MLEFLVRSLDASTIFTIAALGELIGQRSGVLNVGVEGVMLFGATLGFIVERYGYLDFRFWVDNLHRQPIHRPARYGSHPHRV